MACFFRRCVDNDNTGPLRLIEPLTAQPIYRTTKLSEPELMTYVLYGLPPCKGGLHCHAKRMFIIFRMPFYGGMCPSNSAPSRGCSSVLCEYFCQGVCELIAQCSKIGFGVHRFPPPSIPLASFAGVKATRKEILVFSRVPLYPPQRL